MNFAQLSEGLSPATLAALKMHMEASTGGQPESSSSDDVATSGDHVAAPHNSLYKKKEYWDERFTKEDTYDWLLKFADVKTLLLPHLKESDRILIVGCGNSTFSADLYDAGYHNIVNIDYSDVVIESMRDKHATARPDMQWVYMDMCALSFEEGAFDVIIDKAAMDALMVDEGDVWSPEQQTIDATHNMCTGVSRVLAADGVFVMISFMQPHFRTKYLMGKWIDGTAADQPFVSALGTCDMYRWHISTHNITTDGGCLDSFFYVMQRRAGVASEIAS
jgi:EEF1A lysine methyltransferase 4